MKSDIQFYIQDVDFYLLFFKAKMKYIITSRFQFCIRYAENNIRSYLQRQNREDVEGIEKNKNKKSYVVYLMHNKILSHQT